MSVDVLTLLVQTYYHEDWPDQGGLWGTLDIFLSHSNPEQAAVLVAEIEQLLRDEPSEQRLEDLLGTMDSYVYFGPETDGSYRKWLEGIAARCEPLAARAR